MSKLSELLPTGGGQNAVDFVASGTLSSGQTVALKADGTVEAVSGVTEGIGSETSFAGGTITYVKGVYDANAGKVVLIYRNNSSSGAGTAVVGTVSGTSISFGSAVVFESITPYGVRGDGLSIAYDTNAQKVVIAYVRDRSDIGELYARSVVGTVSGTSISFGTNVAFSSTLNVAWVSCAYDSTAQKVVVSYQDLDPGQAYGYAVVGTVSGTSISYGTPVVFNSASTTETTASYDSSNNKIVIAYRDTGNSSYGTGIVGTVSGTSISFGTAAVFAAVTVEYLESCFDASANKTLIAYSNDSASGHGTAVVATVSGTAISFGSPVTFNAASTSWLGIAYVPTAKKTIITYRDVGNSGYGTLVKATISGTSVSFSSEFTFSAISTAYTEPVYTTDGKVAIGYLRDNSNGYGSVYTTPSTNSADFIGITDQAIANTATGAVNVYGGINEAQSGLTIGSDYYVQDDGSIATTSSAVKIGQAISATTINMMDLT